MEAFEDLRKEFMKIASLEEKFVYCELMRYEMIKPAIIYLIRILKKYEQQSD